MYFTFNALLWASAPSQITFNFRAEDGSQAGSYTGQIAQVIDGCVTLIMSECKQELPLKCHPVLGTDDESSSRLMIFSLPSHHLSLKLMIMWSGRLDCDINMH